MRLREKIELKPLVPIKGMPLIEHVIHRVRSTGIDEFVVVSGYRGDELRRSLDGLSAREDIRVTHVVNDDWNRSNGVSLLKAKPHLTENFLLTMCDHLVDPGIFCGITSVQMKPSSVLLAVDFNIVDTVHDLDDVTRVNALDGRIQCIGKQLTTFNCFDTGVFVCTPIIFDALQESQSEGDDTITGAMNVLARLQEAYIFNIHGRAWIDVDDAAAFLKAEKLLEAGRL